MGTKRLLYILSFMLIFATCSAASAGGSPKVGTCWAMGDPHYRTFDGSYFNFMGNCTYVMAKNCDVDQDHPAFEVQAQNVNGANKKMTAVGIVILNVYGFRVSAVRGETGFVEVNYEVWSLPVNIDQGKVMLYQSGLSVVIETDFGLTVQYDYDQYMVVTVPEGFAGKVCGLCGNFNDKQEDDLITPSGSSASSVSAFGQSWKVAGIVSDGYCGDQCAGQCLNCESSWLHQLEGKVFCSLLTSIMNGPLKRCQAVIEPKIYKEMCLFDFCMGEGVKDYLCDTLQVYVGACQRAGKKVFDWRKLAGCPIPKCPENSHYELCGNPCPPTCDESSAPSVCTADCVETCTCNLGYVRSGNQCVLPSQCGCIYQGRYVQAQESFWGDDKCMDRCQCSSGGKIECKNTGCPTGTQCEVKNGIRDCYSTRTGICTISGDPHYKTFDNNTYDFQGTCTYTAATGCHLEGTNLTPFTVVVENENWYPMIHQNVSVAKVVVVEVYGNVLVLQRNQAGVIMVNDILTNLPLNLNNGQVEAYQDGQYDVIKTNFGLIVKYDLVYHVIITLPEQYQGQTCGLCGNFNGKKDDEYQLPDGKLTKDLLTFGAAWKVSVPGVVCDDGCSGNLCPVCDPKKKVIFENDCSIITNPNGPFAGCQHVINSFSYFSDCVYDTCMSEGDRYVLCHSIAAYVADCQDFGVDIKSWRTPTFCPLSCPGNSHYDICAETCATPCPGLTNIISCQTSCAEGCTCNPGYYFNGTGCVTQDQCSCYAHGITYKFGQSVITNSCKKICTCQASGVVQCKSMSCKADEACEVKGGVEGCFPKAVCTISGDPHYRTFDGNTYDFQGSCTYTAATACNLEGTLLPHFTVAVENEKWYPMVVNQKVSVAKLVAVEVSGSTLVLMRNQIGKITVNGVLTNLPLYLNNGTVVAYQDGQYDVIKTDFGLTVKYDLVYHVIISLPESYQGKTCGLCGNYNGNKNEFQLPDGKLTKNLTAFGLAWKASVPGVVCDDGCSGNSCPVCDKEDMATFERDCSILTNYTGPLAVCHNVINPSSYFKDCVYDVCMSEGDPQMLCRSIAAYVANCLDFGVNIKNWRTSTFCPLSCPTNTHYEICSRTCVKSCPGLSGIQNCHLTCAEGCTCNSGYFFNGTGCVSQDQCGCYANGKTYMIGESVISNDCRTVCTCLSTGALNCESMQCGTGERCQVLHGIPGCYQSQCVVKAGGMLMLFNGQSGQITSAGAYDLVELCVDTVQSEWFRVVIEEKISSQSGVATTTAMYIFFQKVAISINDELETWVNGRRVSVTSVFKGDISVQIYDKLVVVEKKSTLTVSFTKSQEITVTVNPQLAGSICGACGKLTDSNMSLTNMRSYMNLWKAHDYS